MCGKDSCMAAGSVVAPLSAMLLKLYVLRQPMLSRSTTDCLEMLCSARNSHLGGAALGDLLYQVLRQETAWLQKDTDLMLALTKLVETGFVRSVGADPIMYTKSSDAWATAKGRAYYCQH